MKLEGITPGTHVVTFSGDVAEMIEVAADGSSARVRYIEVLGGSEAVEGQEATVHPEDVLTVEGTRFVGPGRTSSSSG